MDSYLTQLEALMPKLKFTESEGREIQAFLLLLRAAWMRDSKVDFVGAEQRLKQAMQLVAGVESSTRDDVERDINFQLALTYSQRANIEPAKADDYRIKASSIMSELAAKHYVDAYEPLRNTNHILKKDQETRAIFENIVAAEKGSKDPVALYYLMLLCNNYLSDFQCGFTTAMRLEKLSESQDYAVRRRNSHEDEYSFRLGIAEAYLLYGQYEKASELLDDFLLKSDPPDAHRAVAHFYKSWMLFAQSKEPDANSQVQSWQQIVNKLASRPHSLNWILDGATEMLIKRPPPSTEARGQDQAKRNVERYEGPHLTD
jgi:hypothetical protein